MGELQSLVKLDISTNCLRQLPASMGRLKRIQRIDAANNVLTRVPPSMGHLKSIKELNLKYNSLDDRYKAKTDEGLSRCDAPATASQQPCSIMQRQVCSWGSDAAVAGTCRFPGTCRSPQPWCYHLMQASGFPERGRGARALRGDGAATAHRHSSGALHGVQVTLSWATRLTTAVRQQRV